MLFRFNSLRTKLALSYILAVGLVGILCSIIGIVTINQGIINQAQNRVSADLNSASEIYDQIANQVLNVCRFTATRFFLKKAILEKRNRDVLEELTRVLKTEKLDFLSVIDGEGIVFARGMNHNKFNDTVLNPLIEYVIKTKKPAFSTEILPAEVLYKENPVLKQKAEIKIIPTVRAKYQRTGIETSGLTIMGAAPVLDDNENLLGVVYAGKLINNNFDIVDRIKNTVFMNEQYKGKDIGTSTIFMKDLRVSTNVKNVDGTRAIGTLISKEVYEAVLEKGQTWMARAFVVKDWYITAYKPIKNFLGETIGVLYVGILEKKYTDMRNQIVLFFMGLTIIAMLAVTGFSYLLSGTITKSLGEIARAAREIGKGNFPEKINITTQDEIADLAKAFQYMIDSIKKRDEELKRYAQQTIAEAERLAIIGQLAAGVAHEINNPLTGILLYCDLMLKNFPDDSPYKKNLIRINNEAQRCKTIVKGLLDFAREKKPEIKRASINELIESTLNLLKTQAIFLNITTKLELENNLPQINIDPGQIQQVLINIIMNAVEAMKGYGVLKIKTEFSEDKNFAIISISDTGPGIKPEHIKKIFEPFFTTKEASHGVGLGLSISKRIIEDHNGTIEVHSELGKGATFKIKLPI
ncbi:MAG: cache domain-containing protein [candidate division WOR-3 bacterium]|nr:cache domain-containing protein [candidate division WOR-3 bacterium]